MGECLVKIRVWLSGTVEQALDLGEVGPEIGVRIVGERRMGMGAQVQIEGDEKAIRTVLADCISRGAPRSQWDQPSSWAAACRAAVPKLRIALGESLEPGR